MYRVKKSSKIAHQRKPAGGFRNVLVEPKKEKEKGEKREKKRIRLALLKVILLTSSL